MIFWKYNMLYLKEYPQGLRNVYILINLHYFYPKIFKQKSKQYNELLSFKKANIFFDDKRNVKLLNL